MEKVVFILLIVTFLCEGQANNLFPTNVDVFSNKNLMMPNVETGLRDCPYRYFKQAKYTLASSIFGDYGYDREYAHLVRIGTFLEDDFKQSCEGILIHEDFILTTAECAGDDRDAVKFNDGTFLEISDKIIHPDYDNETGLNNVAILSMNETLSISKTVTPACLWVSDESEFKKIEEIKFDSKKDSFGTMHRKSIRNQTQHIFQIKLLSNFRMTPFLIGFSDNKVAQILTWIEVATNSTYDATECAIKYANFREFEDAMILGDKSDSFHSVQYSKSHITPSEIKEYKAQIGWTNEKNETEFKCGASLIREDYVLTSASCLARQTPNPNIVRLAEITHYYPERIHSFEELNISKIVVHPKFSVKTNDNDIALIKLKGKVNLTEETTPACLWVEDSVPIEIDGFQTNGFGPENLNSFSLNDDLKKTKDLFLYVTSNNYDDKTCQNIKENQLCVGNNLFTVPGTCRNDFGGGMTRQLWHNNKYYQYLFGINSQGKNCGFGTQSVFTRISSHIPWLESVIYNREHSVTFIDTQISLGDHCKTPEGQNGTCILVEKCSKAASIIKNKGERPEICSFEKGPAVCCSDEDAGIEDFNEIDDVFDEILDCPRMYSELRRKYSSEFDPAKPDLAILSADEDANKTCAASLISKRFIITSKSCFATNFVENVTEISVQIGNSEDPDFIPQMRNILNLVKHPKSNLLLVKLDEDVEFSQNTFPSCLWRNVTHTPFKLSSAGTDLEPKTRHPIFNCASDHEVCVTNFENDQKNLCQEEGDQLLSDIRTSNDTIIPYVIGVYAQGVNCDKGEPAVFTRVSSYFAWIKNVVADENE